MSFFARRRPHSDEVRSLWNADIRLLEARFRELYPGHMLMRREGEPGRQYKRRVVSSILDAELSREELTDLWTRVCTGMFFSPLGGMPPEWLPGEGNRESMLADILRHELGD